MKWKNLKLNKCPNCNKDFVMNLTTIPVKGKGQLLAHGCGFKIFERRYSEIVNNQITKELEEKLIKEQKETWEIERR